MAALIFSGPPGVGKTFLATALVLWALLRGRRVAVNWSLRPPEGVKRYCLGWKDKHREDDLCELPHLNVPDANLISGPVVFEYADYEEVLGLIDADVFNDEAQANAGARDWESLGKRVRLWLSMHRHYGLNLLFFTQHYKFVDVYFRRLAQGGVFSLHRLFNLSWAWPRPQADPELGDLKHVDILGALPVVRPWRSLDHPWPLPTFWSLLKVSREVPQHYETRAPRDLSRRPPAAPRRDQAQLL